MKQIIYSEKAQKQVRDIAQGDKKSAALIFEKIEQYAEGSANADVKILHGKYGEFKRLRAGNYRLKLRKEAWMKIPRHMQRNRLIKQHGTYVVKC
jgi:mRNA-degrading endonuclease RelE of RelBE toxin-antitoxin system